MKKNILFLILSILLTACTETSPTGNFHVTASIEPLRYAIESVAGQDVSVTTLTPAGGSAETYQPTPAQIADLSESDAYIRVGTLGFEQTRLRKATENMPHLFAISASAGIPALSHESGEDPHTWVSPISMRIIIDNIVDALCEIDTMHAAQYEARQKQMTARIDSIDHRLRTMLADAPCRTFLINHPALGYFARDYGFRQLAVEHDGKEASAERIANLTRQCREEGVRVVFIQKGHSGRGAESIAREIGAKVVEINPLAYDWEAEILKIASALRS